MKSIKNNYPVNTNRTMFKLSFKMYASYPDISYLKTNTVSICAQKPVAAFLPPHGFLALYKLYELQLPTVPPRLSIGSICHHF